MAIPATPTTPMAAINVPLVVSIGAGAMSEQVQGGHRERGPPAQPGPIPEPVCPRAATSESEREDGRTHLSVHRSSFPPRDGAWLRRSERPLCE